MDAGLAVDKNLCHNVIGWLHGDGGGRRGVGRPARQVPKEVGGEGDRYTGNGTADAARSGGRSARERGLVEVKRRARVERRRAAVRVEHGLQRGARRRRGGLRDQNARRQCYPGDAVAHAREIIQPRGGAPVAEAYGVVRTAARLGVGQPERRERLDAFIIRAQEPRCVARVNLDRSQRKRAQRGRDRRERPRGGAAGLDVDLEVRRERKSLDGGVETLRQRLDVPPPRRELGLKVAFPRPSTSSTTAASAADASARRNRKRSGMGKSSAEPP